MNIVESRGFQLWWRWSALLVGLHAVVLSLVFVGDMPVVSRVLSSERPEKLIELPIQLSRWWDLAIIPILLGEGIVFVGIPGRLERFGHFPLLVVLGLASGLAFGLAFGLVIGLVFGLVFGLFFVLVIGLGIGLVYGLVALVDKVITLVRGGFFQRFWTNIWNFMTAKG